MKLPTSLGAMILGVALIGCSSTSSRGTAGSGGQAGSSTTPGSGGAASGGSGGAGSGGARPGSGGSGGSGGASAGAGGGGHGTGGVAGGHSGNGGASAGAGGGGGAGMCPSGQRWCAGCTPGSGSCSAGVCPGLNCPLTDGGVPDAPGGCATATTEDDCNARGVCHAVFVDGQNCGCAALGCCTRFSRCADGATAMCSTTALSCTLQTPHCEGPYVVAYAGGCYEGCVRSSACAGGAGGGSGMGGDGGHGGSGGAGGATGQTCSSAPPLPCPTGRVCDEDMPNRCGAGAVTGHCIVMPEGCTTDYTPVCGCDNHTYPNDCERQRARVQLAHTGACA